MFQIKDLKNLVVCKLKSYFSTEYLSLLRLVWRFFTSPQYFKSHVNNFRYTKSLYNSSNVDGFVAPLFSVSVNDSCNLRCPNCLYLLENSDKFFNSHIAPAKFRETLGRFNKSKSAETIFLGGGEPLMHPQFEELVDICKDYNFRFIKMATNGILVKKKISAIEKLDEINVSMDSYDYNTFRKYRGGTQKQFDQIIDGLQILNNRRSVKFSLSYVLSIENIHETYKMIEFSEKIGADLVHFHNINPHGSDQFSTLKVQDKNTIQVLNDILKRIDYPFDITLPVIIDPKRLSFTEAGCSQPWSYLVYNSLGNVAYCCHLDQDKEIGNVFDGYDRNSPKMKEFREAIMAGKQAEMSSCRFCQRRFAGQELGYFSRLSKRWFINKMYNQSFGAELQSDLNWVGNEERLQI